MSASNPGERGLVDVLDEMAHRSMAIAVVAGALSRNADAMAAQEPLLHNLCLIRDEALSAVRLASVTLEAHGVVCCGLDSDSTDPESSATCRTTPA